MTPLSFSGRRFFGRLGRVAVTVLLIAQSAWNPAPPAIAGEVPLPGLQQTGRVFLFVELQEDPAAKTYGDTLLLPAASRAAATASAVSAARTQIGREQVQQARVAPALNRAPINATELYRTQNVLNGFAIEADAAGMTALQALPDVKRVSSLPLAELIATNPNTLVGAPSLWQDTLGLGLGLTGKNLRVGILDSGIDYLNPMFGGTGLSADYLANDRTTLTDGFVFPTAKIVGGVDFAGDDYNGSNTPVPDSDPMDCNGHGTAVAGIAGGFGVKSDGTTFTGPYNASTPIDSLRIPPGIAPEAKLYAIKTDGCQGSTRLIPQGLDWAMDPNGDHDLSDHLDVVNISLAADFGLPGDVFTVAADNATKAGIVVVAGIGNSGDVSFVAGTPAIAARAIGVAGSDHGGSGATVLSVSSPGAIAGNYPAQLAFFINPSPPNPPSAIGLAGQVVLAIDGAAPANDGCEPLTNAGAMAGKIALIDRGLCTFDDKVSNAQSAGAIGVIVANNQPGVAFPNLISSDSIYTLTIPTVSISQATGNALKSQLPGTVLVSFPSLDSTDMAYVSTSRGPALGSDVRLKPDIAAPGQNVTIAVSGVICPLLTGCATPNPAHIYTGGLYDVESGTSLATPMVAGAIALLRQLHPDWSPDELKALVMNTATHKVTVGPNGTGPEYGVSRIGAGRLDIVKAAQSNVIAFSDEEPDRVSMTFDGDATVATSRIKRVRLVNKGATPVTFSMGISTTVDSPGASFSIPGSSSVTIPAAGSTTVDVSLNLDPALMDRGRDPSQAATIVPAEPLDTLGPVARHWLEEESGYLNFRDGSGAWIRVPLFAVPRPVSTMSAPNSISSAGSPTQTVTLSGGSVCTGTPGGPVCTGSFPTDTVSLVSPFELQAVHQRNPAVPGYADIQYVGVSYSSTLNLVNFGISTWDSWSSPTRVSFNIFIDTNQDGIYDRVLFNSDPGTAHRLTVGGKEFAQDLFTRLILTLTPTVLSSFGSGFLVNDYYPDTVNSRLLQSNVMFFGATPADLGLSGGDTDFKYKIVSCPGQATICAGGSLSLAYEQLDGPYSYDYAKQGLNFLGAALAQDMSGANLTVVQNATNLAANGSLGALFLHHHNGQGSRAEVAILTPASSADLLLLQTVSNATPALSQTITMTLSLQNLGPAGATGVVVEDLLPAGLTYVSDDGGGSYTPSTGIWIAGSMGVLGGPTLHIAARVTDTDVKTNLARIVGGTPLDPVPSNNFKAVTITPQREVDLMLAASSSAPSVVLGTPVTYTYVLRNTSDDTTHNVVMAQSFPSTTASIQSVSMTAGVFDQATKQWKLGSLGKNIAETLTIVVMPNTLGLLTTVGQASGENHEGNPTNNTASASTNVVEHPTTTAGAAASPRLPVGASVVLTATVIDTGSPATTPAGNVTFSVDPAAGLLSPASCALAVVSPGAAACQVTLTVLVVGPVPVQLSYVGDATHGASAGAVHVTVDPSQVYMTVPVTYPAGG